MHSPGGYVYSPHHAGVGVEPKGYFDAMYFPPAGANAASAAAALASSGGVAAEIMKDTSHHKLEKDVVEKVEKGVGADGGVIQASSSTTSSSSSSLDDQRLSRDKSPQSASSSMAETNATGASWFTKSESGDQDQDREDVVEHDHQVNKTHLFNASTNSLDSVRGFEEENVISRSHSMSGRGGKRESGGACRRDRGRGEAAVVQVDPPQGVHRAESDPLQLPHGRLVEQAFHAIVSGGQ